MRSGGITAVYHINQVRIHQDALSRLRLTKTPYNWDALLLGKYGFGLSRILSGQTRPNYSRRPMAASLRRPGRLRRRSLGAA